DWTFPQLENTLHVPFWVTHGVADELVPVTGVKRQTDRFAELGHEYRFALHPAADHLSFAAQDEWSREVAWSERHPVRTEDPAEITYKLRPASWATDGDPEIVGHLRALAAEVGANIDGAYWVDDVEVAGDGDVTGFVDLTSHGISRRRSGTTPINTVGTDGPSPHHLTGMDVAYDRQDVADELTGRLSNVSALTIDVGRADLSNSPGLDIEVDREVTITLVRKGAVVRRVSVGGTEAAEHSAEHATVTNPDDGTEIAITIFEPAAAADRDVPVVFHSHGWAGSRETEIAGLVEPFLDAGFGVVSIDQRGHGDSTGQAHVQDPTKETEDIQAVIDFVAKLDWVKLESPGDPVLGAVGLSYGGGYQTMTALDEIAETGSTRFDALAPEITWYDLPESLAPQGVVRTAWNFLLYGVGARMVPQHIHEAFAWGTATGQWPDGTVYGQPAEGAPNLDRIFHEHSPVAFVEDGIRIDVPVLLRQGTSDNLFPLNEGLDNFRETLTPKARKRSFFVAFNGGHALPNAVPRGEPVAVEVGTGVDACNEDFTRTTIEFFRRVFSGKSTKGVLPGRYNLTTLTGEDCLHLSRLGEAEAMAVDPTGTGSLPLTTGAGAPLHVPLAEGPRTLAGVPTLRGRITAAGLDSRVFFGLAVGTSPADATVIQNNLLPLRRALPVQDQEFSIELPGVVAEVPEGQSLFLTISPVSDMYVGHGSRTPGAVVLSDLSLTLPSS
ncbi:MAG: alpha/beta fold hydrolase, partial [Actinomycetota bacterium]